MGEKTEKQVLKKALDALLENILVVGPDFTVLANTLAGKKKSLGEKCHEALFERQAPCVQCPVPEVLSTGKSTAQPLGGMHYPNGEEKCLMGVPIQENGEVSAVAVADLNLWMLGGMDEQVRRSNALLKNLIMSSVDGVIAADMTGRILIFNEAASQICGYDEQEALYDMDIRGVYPDGGAKEVMKKMRGKDHGGKGKLKGFEVKVRHKNGEDIPILLNAAVVYEKGREAATIGFFHDMREELQMKQELQLTQMQLLQSEKMASLGKLAAGVAHQLNNPLGGIILFSQLVLEEYELPDGAKADIKRILEDAQRCRDTVKELLEFSRQTKEVIRKADINQAISRTLFLLENQSLFRNIVIKRKFDQNLPHVPMDIQQMNHVFMNLILNAAEAMEGDGELKITTHPSADNKRVCIRIADTGPGIGENVLPHLFEPFFTTKDEGKGTGLGLSLVYGIVKNHGGAVCAKNRPEKGAQFIIELPVNPKEQNHAQ